MSYTREHYQTLSALNHRCVEGKHKDTLSPDVLKDLIECGDAFECDNERIFISTQGQKTIAEFTKNGRPHVI